ncbi:hypothetical protein QUF74_13675 [Candidatus Halobeggiatoa sp. HSG11]|nr:hypothetical protein [Candidatus Halobeggiatoa sp. HSG11]
MKIFFVFCFIFSVSNFVNAGFWDEVSEKASTLKEKAVEKTSKVIENTTNLANDTKTLVGNKLEKLKKSKRPEILCKEASFYKELVDSMDYRGALLEIHKCIALYDEPATKDIDSFNAILTKILEQKTVSETELYKNFVAILSLPYFSNLNFRFSNYFETQPTKQASLFPDVHLTSTNKYHFYFDTGRVMSDGRGLALTKNSILWKNLLGTQESMSFSNLKNFTLIFERGVSLSGWKLRINVSEKNDIRLSRLPKEGVVPFISALLYFVNSHKLENQEKVSLNLSKDAILMLTTTFYQRHEGLIGKIVLKGGCLALEKIVSAATGMRLSGSCVGI